MTDKELLKLYQLKGMLKGKRTILKAQISAAHATRNVAKSDGTVDRMTGQIQQGVADIRAIQHVIRKLSQIIKEVGYA